jgi:6,7-dimethyl-8-ribityllumazine synthase
MTARTVSGALDGKGMRIGIVVSRFNDFIVDRLLHAAIDGLVRHGVSEGDITIVRVPGALEIALAAQRLARSKKHDAVVCLGCVIRGETNHFDQVCAEVSRGVAQAALDAGRPVTFGVVTAENLEQAIERAGAKGGNRGWDAALAAIEMVAVLKAME